MKTKLANFVLILILLVLLFSLTAASYRPYKQVIIQPGETMQVFCPEGRPLARTEFGRVVVWCIPGD